MLFIDKTQDGGQLKNNMRIMVTGANGQLGSEIKEIAEVSGLPKSTIAK